MTGSLPLWLERILGVAPREVGEGAYWSLDHAWAFAPWLTVLFIVAALVIVAVCYRREIGSAGFGWRCALGGLRLLALALIVFMLAEFVLSLKRTGLPYCVVLIDDSQSMERLDQYDAQPLTSLVPQILTGAGLQQPTRLNLAKATLLRNDAALFGELRRRYKLRVYAVGDGVRPIGDDDQMAERIRDLPASGAATRLGDGVRAILNELRGNPPAAVILLSDGVNTEGEPLLSAAAYARRKGTPIYTVGLGDAQPAKDLKLSDLVVDDVVFVDDVVNFQVKLTGVGYAGKQVEISLRRLQPEARLAATTVEVGADEEAVTVRLPYTPTEEGDFQYVVEVAPMPHEQDVTNNSQTRSVSVRNETLKVLLVQSYPNYEYRYLKNLLDRATASGAEAKKTFELHTVLQQADVQHAEQDAASLRVFPVRREDLFAYDVLIFGDVDPAFLSGAALQNINEFVTEKGGGLIVIAGPRYTPLAYGDTPLAELLPLDSKSAQVPPADQPLTAGFRVQPTELGREMPNMFLGDSQQESSQLWRKLPPLYWMLDVGQLKPAARVLATHPSRVGPQGEPAPLFVMQYVGAGEVLFHATDETWRWRLRIGDTLLARYWVQTIRYLSRAKLMGKNRAALLTLDRDEYRRGDSVRMRLRFLDERLAPADNDAVTVIVQHQGGQDQKVQLSRRDTARGLFEATLSQPEVGNYHLWLATPKLTGEPASANFTVVAPPGETQRVEMDAETLTEVAKLTDGRFYTIATVDRLLSDLPRGRQVPIEALPPVTLWNRWPVLAMVLALLIAEWIGRKRLGML